MMGCEDSITLTLIGNHDFQLLLWNPADVDLLRSRYRMVCTYIGCLPSNPLQNIEHSLPALVSFEQLLILLGFGGYHSSWDAPAEKQAGKLKINLELLTPLRCSSLNDYKDSKDLALALPRAPPLFLNMLSRLRSSPRFSIYEYLYSLPKNLYITSGSKFGGDFSALLW
ncbi:tRNA-splicing endonuclease subunit Sen34 [Entomophthora muscae]|uniref:tRNA-splicing endonuclease subunit Sen34 n=1 Tax=Entomophthora muscae TaxID=34485 RepID=A0ACC2TRW2_9FUNG|nr:tRNA-splicing endonuclease subunit Sen34 [Entomophthora muscae]